MLQTLTRRDGGLLQAVVPETNLGVQLFLRDAGFLAAGVVRDHFDSEDGYLMELASA
jgi:hypothetical protein